MPANVVTAEERWVTNPDGSKRRRSTPLPPAVDADAPAFVTPKTHKAADAQAAERGLTFPEGVTTVKAKAAFLASA